MLKTKFAKITALLGAVVITAAAWFLISPLLIDKQVDEALVFAAAPVDPETSNQAMQQVMADAAQTPDRTVKESMMMESEPHVLVRGKFHDADSVHRGSGDALLYQLADGSHLLRLEDFKVTNGPDLAVYLVKHADPSSSDQVTSGFLNLGKLKGNVGNQNYAIPAGTDLSEFNSAVIWCELFGVLFSTAPLSDG
ncbi:MAG: DM13 domain-containing protein [Halioglobus sp.]